MSERILGSLMRGRRSLVRTRAGRVSRSMPRPDVLGCADLWVFARDSSIDFFWLTERRRDVRLQIESGGDQDRGEREIRRSTDLPRHAGEDRFGIFITIPSLT